MAKYITKQRKAFLDYLELNPDEPMTAKQIANALQDKNINLSTVYRNLCDLEAEGKIRRFTRSGNREVFYQYVDSDVCKSSLHLSCKKCGKTFHMKKPSVQLIVHDIAENENFVIDKTDTVIYGICKGCQK